MGVDTKLVGGLAFLLILLLVVGVVVIVNEVKLYFERKNTRTVTFKKKKGQTKGYWVEDGREAYDSSIECHDDDHHV